MALNVPKGAVVADLYHPELKRAVTVPDRSAPALKRSGWTNQSDHNKSTAPAIEPAPATPTAPEGATTTPTEGATS